MAEVAAVPFPELFRLDGRVALVTGGAGLLGRRYCEALLQAGARVVIGDLDGARAAALAAELSADAAHWRAAGPSAETSLTSGLVRSTESPPDARPSRTAEPSRGAETSRTAVPSRGDEPSRTAEASRGDAPARTAGRGDGQGVALGLRLDVSDVDSVRATVDTAVAQFGRLDILVNNAALTVRGGAERLSPADYFAPFEDYPREVWDQALSVNLTGMMLCAQAAGRQMLAQDPPGGVMVNISSTYGVVAPDQRLYEGVKSPYGEGATFNTPVSYAVTKTAVLGLTRYLATYWGRKHIRVNALTPHGVFDNHDDAFVHNFVYRSPLGRMARNDEYRGALLFLVSDASSYMTGSNLIVDGGWTTW